MQPLSHLVEKQSTAFQASGVLFFTFWPRHATWGIPDSWAGMEPVPPAVEAGEVPRCFIKKKKYTLAPMWSMEIAEKHYMYLIRSSFKRQGPLDFLKLNLGYKNAKKH